MNATDKKKSLRKIVTYSFIGITVLILGFLAFAAYMLFSKPPGPRQPLAQGLLSLESTKGKSLLKESKYKADYKALQTSFTTQKRRAFCGVASSVMTIKALNPKKQVDQSSIFTEKAREVFHPWLVSLRGMTLQELARLLRSHSLQAKGYHADTLTLKSFRALLRKNLKKTGDVLLVNYDRKILKQKGSGHISPLGAYHAASDQVLILDVSSYKYPPVWLKTALLYKAIHTKDSGSQKFRGVVEVAKQ